VAGKALGISLSSLLALRLGVGGLPRGVQRRHLPGAATLAGIGFTVSLFVCDLAFDDEALRDEARIGVLVASVLAAALGWVAFRLAGPAQAGPAV
jgi:Na+/H+ antiporter NhaA